MKKHILLTCVSLLVSLLSISASIEVRSTHMTTTDGLANNSNIQQIWSDMVTNIFVNGADIAAELQNAAALIDEQLA